MHKFVDEFNAKNVFKKIDRLEKFFNSDEYLKCDVRLVLYEYNEQTNDFTGCIYVYKDEKPYIFYEAICVKEGLKLTNDDATKLEGKWIECNSIRYTVDTKHMTPLFISFNGITAINSLYVVDD